MGLFRDRLLTHTFGAGAELDAYYAAFRVPDLVYSLFVWGAISAGFIPVFAKFADESEQSDAAAGDLVSRLLSLMGLLLVGFAVLGYILAPFFTPPLSPGFSGGQLTLTVRLTRIMFLSPVLLGLSGVLGAVLQTRKRFLAYSLAPVLYNIGIIAGTLALAPRYGVAGVAWGVVLGACLHFAVQSASCGWLGIRLRWRPDPRHPGIGEVVRLTLPRVASLAFGQVNILAVTAFVTAMGVGSLAVFNLSSNLTSFPVNIIGVSIAAAAFPFISELAEKGRTGELVQAVARSSRMIFFFAIPATIGLLLLRAQVVRVVLGSGKFDWNDTIATADSLAALSLGIFAASLIPLAVRAFFAVKDTITPLTINGATAATGVLMAWLAVHNGWGVAGICLTVSAANVLNIILLWVALRFRLGSLDEAGVLRSISIMSLAGLSMAIVLQVSKTALGSLVDMTSFWGILTQGAVAGSLGLLVYFGMMLWFGNNEARALWAQLRRRLALAPTAVRQGEDTIEVA